MSAFAVIYERTHAPLEPGILERVMARLAHRGPDGSDTWLSSHAAMGHWHFWTTPEEVGEKQPLQVEGLSFRIVFDGRLDNRAELLHALRLEAADHLSDAALVLHAYDRWEADCFGHFVGEYALVILDESRAELVCARDALGDRSLFYSTRGTRLVIASEAWAAAGADGGAAEWNGTAAARFFAFRGNEDGATLFKDVQELLPARAMTVSALGTRTWRTWEPNLSFRLRGKSDRDYAEGFLPLLEESVRCRLRSPFPPAVMMSGGLDSTSVACLAARMTTPDPLHTISYVFDEFPSCDERRYIETVRAKYGIRTLHIPCDDLWPYRDLADFPHNPNQPDGNTYRMIIERTYRSAAEAGLRVLLTGTYGDELYDGDEDWLADMLSDGRFGEAARDLLLHLRYAGLGRTLRSAYLRRAALRAFASLPGGERLLGPVLKRARRGRSAPAWLTPFAVSLLPADASRPDPAFEAKRNLLGVLTAGDCASEQYFSGRFGLELRHPYRDRRLVEYVLSLPAHQLYNHGQYKHVLRTAMQGILPEAIRIRSRPTALLALFAYGVARERDVLLSFVEDPEAAWRKYVRTDWLAAHWDRPVTIETDGMHAVVPWLCVAFSTWQKPFERTACYRLAGQEIHFSHFLPELRLHQVDGGADVPAWELPAPASLKLACRAQGWVGDQTRDVEVWSAPPGYLLKVAGGSDFYLAPEAKAILRVDTDKPAWEVKRGEIDGLDRDILLGPALVLALAQRGIWCLHASAARFRDTIFVFLGESGMGKSTLAAYLAASGWTLVADDILPVTQLRSGVEAWPHFPQLKLPPHSQPAASLPQRIGVDRICLLSPADEWGIPSLQLLFPSHVVRGWIANTAGARLFDAALLGRHLAFCGLAARHVRAYRLKYPHRMDALPLVREFLEKVG